MKSNRARQLRQNMTKAEKILWNKLRGKQLNGCKFRRQQPIGDYIVDFVCFDENLIIEVDGGQHAKQKEQDRERSQWLDQEGFKVIRFWNNDILSNTENVVEEILRTLKSH